MSTRLALIVLLIAFVLYLCLSLITVSARRRGDIRTARVVTGVSTAVFIFLIIVTTANRSVSRVVEIVAVVVLGILLLAGALNGLFFVLRRRR